MDDNTVSYFWKWYAEVITGILALLVIIIMIYINWPSSRTTIAKPLILQPQ